MQIHTPCSCQPRVKILSNSFSTMLKSLIREIIESGWRFECIQPTVFLLLLWVFYSHSCFLLEGIAVANSVYFSFIQGQSDLALSMVDYQSKKD